MRSATSSLKGILLFCFLITGLGFTFGQNRSITGVVEGADGEALIGATVSVVGTSIGVVTDVDGKYVISVPESGALLLFAYLGYESVEMEVGINSEINVRLNQNSELIDEVVVMGYSEKKKSELTGSVVNVSSEKLKGVTGSNVEYMLQGKAAGVQVSSSSGAPGAVAEIRIRGNSSINADRGPLVVVDGIIGGTYNPNDVESLTVLKDAGAIALYGSRANNGVIIITTKRGSADKTEISYKTSVGLTQITTGNFQLMNSAELYATERAMFSSSATFNVLRPSSLTATDTDWLGLAYGNGMVQNHNISATGKTGKVTYYIAGDYFDNQGTLLSTEYNRFNFRTNLDIALSDAVSLTTNLNASQDNNQGYHWRWPYQPFLYLPYDTPYDNNGNIAYIDGTTDGFLTRDKNNILQSAQYNDYLSKGFNFNADVVLSINLSPNLKFQSRNRYGFATYRSDTYEDLRTFEGRSNSGILAFGTSNGLSLISTNLLKFNKEIGPGNFRGFIGFEGQKYTAEDGGANGIGIVAGIKIPGGVASPQGISGGRIDNRAMSVISELGYDFNETYFLSLSYRRDGSSVFGQNKRWGNFGAVSASWLLHKEKFFDNLSKSITLLKLRGSYGIVGNDAIPAFQYLAKYNFTTQYNGGSAGYPETLPNPDLGWEQTKTGDLGLDISLWNRLDINVDAFHKNTDQLLLKVQLPPSQGIAEVFKNAGQIVTNGLELGVNGDVLQKGDLNWNLGFNIGSAQNEIKALALGTNAINKDYDGVKQSIQVGNDINSWYLPKWVGVNPDNGDPQWEKAVLDESGNVIGYELTNQYAEASSTSSLQFVGTATPKFYGGLNTGVSYKNFALNVSTAFQYGNKVYHRTREFIDADGANFNFNMMQLADGWSRWFQPGDQATHPRPQFGGNL